MAVQTRTSKRRRPVAEINVVPYIDVMLVLLVIFMVTTPLLNQGVDIDLPQASSNPITSQTEPLIISVDTNGNYYLNVSDTPENPIKAEDLALRVAAELALAEKNHEQRGVFIKGDKGVAYGKVVEAMALLQQSGVEKVGLMTQPQNVPSGMARTNSRM